MAKACPKCFSPKLEGVHSIKKNGVETVCTTIPLAWRCRRCGWEGQREELVSLKKFSVVRMGKIRSQMKRRRR